MMRSFYCDFFFFNDTATTEIYTLSLHDALPISNGKPAISTCARPWIYPKRCPRTRPWFSITRSEEHTSELQSHLNLVCRLLLEKKKSKEPLSGIHHCVGPSHRSSDESTLA